MPIIKIDHIKLRRIIIIIAIFLIIIGCFFPWQIEGDFVNDITFGIQIYPSINDNGGLLLFFLSFFILILTIKPPNFIIYPQKMINIIN